MEVNGLFSVTPRGGKTILYIARADIPKVQALEWDSDRAVTNVARYDTRPVVGREKREKHIPYIKVYGTCAEGTRCGAILTLRLNNTRNLNFASVGMFDRNNHILFYQEFPIAATLCVEARGLISNFTSVNGEIWETEFGYTEKA